MGIELLFMGLAILFYFIAIAMPSRKWLVVLFIIYSLFIGIPYFLFSRSGDWMGMLLLMAVSAIAFFGILAKALSLYLKKNRYSRKFFLLPLILGLPIGVGIFIFPFKYHEWKERPVDASCTSKIFPFKIDDVIFELPFFPIFSVYFDPFPVLEAYKEGIVFHEESGVREACGLIDSSGTPVPGTKLTILIKNAEYASWNSVHDALCPSRRSAWEKELCAPNLQADALDYPYQVYIYSKSAFVASWAEAQSEATYKRFQNDTQQGIKGQANGYIHAGEHYYWVSDDPEQKTPDDNPFTLSCDASVSMESVSCLIVYGLTDKVNVQFSVYGSGKEVPEKAWNQNKKLLALIKEIQRTAKVYK